MLVSISGSQGSGKSTILKQIKNNSREAANGAHLFGFIERKTSRSILTDWGVSLNEVNNDPKLALRFQDEIIARKYNDETQCRDEYTTRGLAWYTERTFADLFTYALVALGKDNQHSEWLNQYYNQCMKYQQIYDRVYYLRAGHFNIEHDGTRSSNIHYSRMVDITMLDITRQMTHTSKLQVIETPCLEQRVSIITNQTQL